MMHSRCNGPILFGAIAICVALAVMESDAIVNKPYDPKMCAHLYNETTGCSSHFYSTSNLSCHLTPVTLAIQNSEKRIYGINTTKDKYRSHAENDVRCIQDKTTCTRRYTINCTPTVSNQPTLPGKGLETREKMRRLLLFAPMQPARQLYTDNNSVVNYPFYQASNIRAIAYIPSHRKLVISDSGPDLLFFMPIDNKTKTIIKSKEVSLAIAIDDKKQLVFMITRSQCLYVMSTHGKNITKLFCPKTLHITGYNFDGLVADHNRSMIYLLFRHEKIARFTYKGVSKGNVVKNNLLKGFGLHLQGNDLYYQTNVRRNMYCLHKFSLSDQSDKQYKALSIPKCYAMATVGNILYMITAQFRGDLLVVNTSDMGTVGKVNTGIKQTKQTMSFGAKMCLLP